MTTARRGSVESRANRVSMVRPPSAEVNDVTLSAGIEHPVRRCREVIGHTPGAGLLGP